LFKDIEHLIRLAVVMVIALVVFLSVRAAVVPRSFGQYGHYRGAALSEVSSRIPAFAGHDVCEGCHGDIADVKKQGKHIVVPCEACHGALARHAEDPTSIAPVKLNAAVLCARCHEANSAKPKAFPQVVTADHSGGADCTACHQPHRPKIEVDTKTEAKK
jgi:hypothetical protein